MIRNLSKLCIAFIIINLIHTGCNKKSEQLNKDNISDTSLMTKEGKYLDYEYVYMEKENKIVFLFPNKFLPRNDAIVVGAIKHIIDIAYNESLAVNSKPSLENRNGINLIKFNGNGSNYFVQIIKEDTGEVQSLVIWGEKQ